VTVDIAPHVDESDDTALLERICAAYIKAADRQRVVRSGYRATPWWQKIQQRQLSAVRHALATRDIKRLQAMYRNFFHDPCSTGLVPRPADKTASHFGGVTSEMYRRFILSETRYRIDYWRSQTEGRFSISALQGPAVGNPFGAMLEGTLVPVRAEYQHYCAQRILDLTTSHDAIVAEIGGGFGGMAYYLLRDCPKITYIDFDVPESLALTAYYLSKSMPQFRMLLYGEEELTQSAISAHDIILMPPWELGKLTIHSVDITFSSHALSDLISAAQAEYLSGIERATRDWFLYIGAEDACESLRAFMEENYPSLVFTERRPSAWNCLRAPKAIEVEYLHRVQK
jgi:putative sugar O-methyltransferase